VYNKGTRIKILEYNAHRAKEVFSMTRTLRLRVTAIVTVIAMLMVAIPAQALATDVLGESIGLKEIPLAPSNMTISKEVAMFDSVIDNLWTAREKLYDNPAVVGAPYVPVGATCLEVYSVGNVVYVNYVMNNTYYYTTYYKNTGEVEKVARVKNSDDIYSVSTASTTASVVRNLDEWRSTYTYSAETDSFILVEQSIGRQSVNERTYIFINVISPAPAEEVFDYSSYDYLTNGSITYPGLADMPHFPEGTSTTLDYELLEKHRPADGNTVDNFSIQDFNRYTTVSQIAGTFGASIYYIRGVLQEHGIGIDSNDCITQDASILESGYELYEADVVGIIYCNVLNMWINLYSYIDYSEPNPTPQGRWDFYWTDFSGTGLGHNEPIWVETCNFYNNIPEDYILSEMLFAYLAIVEWGFVGGYDPFFFDDI